MQYRLIDPYRFAFIKPGGLTQPLPVVVTTDPGVFLNHRTHRTHGINPSTVMSCFRVFWVFRGSLLFGDKSEYVVAAPLIPHTSRPLHPTAWLPFSTGALAGGVRGGGAEGADRA